jgi:hypothetical protein
MYCEVNGWVIQFRTRLQGLVRDQWYNLTSRLNHVCLNNEKDYIYWKRTPSKTFTVKSVYDHLTKDDDGPKFQRVWKAKIPEKIKTSMWLVEQAILTKDNMMKQNWQGDPMCYFCEGLESVDHLFFECPTVKVIWGVIPICFGQRVRPKSYEQFWKWIPIALPGGDKLYMFGLATICWAIWKCRNKICFEKKLIKNPSVILHSACSFIRY